MRLIDSGSAGDVPEAEQSLSEARAFTSDQLTVLACWWRGSSWPCPPCAGVGRVIILSRPGLERVIGEDLVHEQEP